MTHRRNIADIHDALLGLADELKRRNRLPADDLADVSRLIVAIDSAGGTLCQLARYWETFRQQDDPQTSPAVTVLEEALWTGRSARVQVILDGTPPQSSVLGAAAHELFATVILARFTADTWRRLAPIAGSAPRSGARPGSAHIVQNGTGHPTQLLLMTDAEAADWLPATAAEEN